MSVLAGWNVVKCDISVQKAWNVRFQCKQIEMFQNVSFLCKQPELLWSARYLYKWLEVIRSAKHFTKSLKYPVLDFCENSLKCSEVLVSFANTVTAWNLHFCKYLSYCLFIFKAIEKYTKIVFVLAFLVHVFVLMQELLGGGPRVWWRGQEASAAVYHRLRPCSCRRLVQAQVHHCTQWTRFWQVSVLGFCVWCFTESESMAGGK